jgi:hypothetical protein
VKAPMTGWIVFAGVAMTIVGILNFFEGLIAVVRDDYYVIHGDQLVVFDTTTWGWVMLIWGIVLFFAGLALMGGSGFARWLTIILASLNVVGQLGWLGASSYPLWTLVIIALNIIVIYALCARWEGYSEQAAA